MKTNPLLISALVVVLLVCAVTASAASEIVSRNPYLGAIVIDAATGKVLFADNADVRGYPASITKLMVLLVILDAVEARRLTLDEPVTVTAKAAKIGGSQVYLKENEVFPVEELLYALMVQSANDAATALAIHYTGGKEAFVDLMNRRAQGIGMRSTVFRSVHGLPPGRGSAAGYFHPARYRKAVSRGSEEARRFEIYFHQAAPLQGRRGRTVHDEEPQSAARKNRGVRRAENRIFQSGGVFHRGYRIQRRSKGHCGRVGSAERRESGTPRQKRCSPKD